MIMQMRHGLSGPASVVRHQPERRELRVFGDPARHALQMTQKGPILVRRRGKRPQMFLGNHQHVRRSLGIDVLEDQRLLVLMKDLSGKLASHDPAEQTVSQQLNGEYILMVWFRQGPIAPVAAEPKGPRSRTAQG